MHVSIDSAADPADAAASLTTQPCLPHSPGDQQLLQEESGWHLGDNKGSMADRLAIKKPAMP